MHRVLKLFRLSVRRGLAALLLPLFGLTVVAATAEPVYKSVDPGGTVSYGDKPVAGAALVKEIVIHGGPSAEQVREAEAVTEQIRSSAAEMEAERLAREAVRTRERRARELEQQYQAELEAEIEQAKQIAETQRLEQEKLLERARQKGRGRKAKPKGPPSTADKAINMRSGVPLLNLPGPSAE